MLYSLDEDFRELFKVKAEFDVRMDRSEENIRNYVAFVSTLCNREGLRALDAGAVAKIVEYGSRASRTSRSSAPLLGGRRRRASGQLLGERDGSAQVAETHVRKAIDEKVYRSNLIQERSRVHPARHSPGGHGGEAVGRSTAWRYRAGRPCLRSALAHHRQHRPGQAGLVDIERERAWRAYPHQGRAHPLGYLSRRYAFDKP